MSFYVTIMYLFPDLPLPADMQGVSWEAPTDVGRLATEALTNEEPLYAVPKKDHHPKFTIDDFILHKMLGKGSFGKVVENPCLKKRGFIEHAEQLGTQQIISENYKGTS